MTNEAALADSSSPPRRQSRACLWWGLLGVAAVAGAASAVAFATLQGGGFDGRGSADLLLFLAVVVCAIGYAEGGLVSRGRGGGVGCAGLSRDGEHVPGVHRLVPEPVDRADDRREPGAAAAAADERVWAWGLLGERVGWTTVLGGVAVIVFALLAMRSRGDAR